MKECGPYAALRDDLGSQEDGIDVEFKQCLERNRAREGKGEVPDVAIFATLKKLTRPSYAEGFSKLFYVCNKGDEGFEVSDWKEEKTTDTSTYLP